MTKMTQKAMLFLGLLLAVLLVSGVFTAPKAEQSRGDNTECLAYQYPDTPVGLVGSDAFEIPQKIVDSMSTDCLLRNVLAYPNWFLKIAYSSPQTGFERIRENFHALDSLLRRPDAASTLVKFYLEADLNRLGEYKEDYFSQFEHELNHLEFMFGAPEIVKGLTKKEKIALLNNMSYKRIWKEQHVDVFSSWDIESMATAGARIMLSMPETRFQGLMDKDPGVEHFVNTAALPPPNVLDTIFDAINKTVNGQPVSQAELKVLEALAGTTSSGVIPTDRVVTLVSPSLTLEFPPCDPDDEERVSKYTPKGTEYKACRVLSDASLSSRQRTDARYKAEYPTATLLRSSTRLYNCHSYAWLSQSSSNKIWVNTPGDDVYWLDGSYRNWTYANSAIPDYVVSVRSDDHSARTVSKTDTSTFISKWGAAPLMRHKMSSVKYEHSPYNGSRLIYYDRPQ